MEAGVTPVPRGACPVLDVVCMVGGTAWLCRFVLWSPLSPARGLVCLPAWGRGRAVGRWLAEGVPEGRSPGPPRTSCPSHAEEAWAQDLGCFII